MAHRLVTPTEDTLGTLTFLPYVRSGIAGTLTQPFSPASPWRPAVTVSLSVSDGAGSTPVSRAMVLRGPGDVLGFDPNQVIRTFPRAGAHDSPPNYMAHVEFDRPDLPWMFTPTGPDAQGNLPPWIVLIVVPASSAFTPAAGEMPARVAAARRDLPDLAESWAWAHAQVAGPRDDAAPLAERLSEANPALNLSRLLCPLNLRADREYRACVVPAFRAGADAGMGREISTPTLAPAWSGGPADELIELPVYYEWRFATGEMGDFEELASRLQAKKAPPTLGVRRLDATHAGRGIATVAPDANGALELVGGPVVAPDFTPFPGPWKAGAARADLVQALNAPDDALKTNEEDADPAIGPPIYGGTHLARTAVQDEEPPPWFSGLNLDPAHRVVAGLGARVVQAEQEELMASAWVQVQGVEAANRELMLAQFGRYVGERLHVRHIKTLRPADLLAVTHLVQSRVLDQPALTVRAVMADSSLPLGVASSAFRRLARDRGPVARFVKSADARRALVADADGVTRSWVRTHTPPDATARVSAEAVALAGPAAEPVAAVMAETPSFPDLLGMGLADRVAQDDGTRLMVEAVEQIVQRLLETTPDPEAMAADRNTAEVGLGRAVLLDAVVQRMMYAVPQVRVRAGLGRGLNLPIVGEDGPTMTLETEGLFRVAEDLRAVAREFWGLNPDEHAYLEEREVRSGVLDGLLQEADALSSPQLAEGLASLAAVMVPELPGDMVRTPVNVAALELVDRLAPARTVTARIVGRLRDWPAWLPGDWFAGGRVERVMATPTFPFPMWEALDRYDRRWMMPGMGEFEPSEVVTVLKTNECFVEAFLVGLNAEMARELLWRGYPTDQRGTCFSSFWTNQPELVAPLHQWTAGALGDHVRPDLKGALVLVVRGEVVRRYPDLIAQAQQASGIDAAGSPLLTGPLARKLFTAFLAPNILLAGFDLTREVAEVPANQWWFTLSEHPVGPRFGFDEGPAGPPGTRHVDDLTWGDLQTPEGAVLRAGAPNLTTSAPNPLTWGDSASANGAITLQLPARAALRATEFFAELDRNA